MKKIFSYFLIFSIALILNGCASSKKVVYMQNIDEISLEASKMLYETKIMPKDLLTITVNSSNPAAAAIFNLSVSQTIGTNRQIGGNSGSLLPYLVENDGTITFPELGKIQVVGMTKLQLRDYITERIKPYFADTETPVVTVTMSGFHVTVMGEVGRPGLVNVTNEKINILEALAQSGDLTLYGKRKNVLLIRENQFGEKESHRIDLTDANLINSEYYYLQQNDILYVQPNRAKAAGTEVNQTLTYYVSFLSILVTITNLLINIIR